MIYHSPLSLTSDVDVFSAVTNAASDTNLGRMRNQCRPLFDTKTLKRFYFHNGHQGVSSRVYENNSIQLIVQNSMADVITVSPLAVVIGPVRRLTNYVLDIVAHTTDGQSIPVPKNNLDINQMAILDVSKDVETVTFNLVSPSHSHSLMFLPDSNGEYKFQKEHVRNFYMPPNKAVRKEYREKIGALVKKVTLLSYLKDDSSKSPRPPEALRNLGMSFSGNTPVAARKEAIFDHIDGSYEAQLFMKSIIEKTNDYYVHTYEKDLVSSMIKYYTQFRNEVEVEHFTCNKSSRWG